MTRILYLASVDWHSIRQRPQQLALRLAKHFDVTYVDPVGLRSLRLTDAARLWRRAVPIRPDAVGLPLIRPRYVPLVGNRWLDQANRRWLLRQVRRQFAFDDDWILWLSTPSLLAQILLDECSPRLVVYDSMDHYAAFHRGCTRDRIERAEAQIVRRAQVVFASSRGLAERLAGDCPVVLVPNGVECDHFRVDRGAMPEWRQRAAGPVVGFYGTLGDWIDFDLLSALARQRPGWTFVFAGPSASHEFKALRRLDNVRYLGVIDYAELPRHAVWFDTALVPFRLNSLTACVHPIKALEYLALGLPVVSTPLDDLADLTDVIQFASSGSEWIASIEAALAAESRSAEAIASRRQEVRAHDWDHRVSTIVGEVHSSDRRWRPIRLPL